MQILSETTHYGEFYFAVGFVALVAIVLLLMAIGFFNDRIVLGGVICIILSILMSLAVYNGFKKGANITYKATITDFNLVYDQGYKVTGQDGEIYFLEKNKKQK